jgi:hypothetical protein
VLEVLYKITSVKIYFCSERCIVLLFCSVSAGLPLATDTRRMHLDFDQLSSSDEDMSKKKTREKRIRHEMAEHNKSASRVVNTFENRYNAQMKMLKEQNNLLKGFFLCYLYFSYFMFLIRTTKNDS